MADEQKNTVRYGLETICYKDPYFWVNLPDEYTFQNSLSKFKEKNN